MDPKMRLLVAPLACTLSAATPKLRLTEVQYIVPEKYRADLSLSPDKDEFSGSIRIQIKLNRPSQLIWLNANQITVQQSEVAAAGKTLAAKPQLEGNDFLALHLDSPVPAGVAEIRIRYTGKVRSEPPEFSLRKMAAIATSSLSSNLPTRAMPFPASMSPITEFRGNSRCACRPICKQSAIRPLLPRRPRAAHVLWYLRRPNRFRVT